MRDDNVTVAVYVLFNQIYRVFFNIKKIQKGKCNEIKISLSSDDKV